MVDYIFSVRLFSGFENLSDINDFKYYSRTNLTSMEDCKLWDIWYTASTHFPSEVSSYMLLYSRQHAKRTFVQTADQPICTRFNNLRTSPAARLRGNIQSSI